MALAVQFNDAKAQVVQEYVTRHHLDLAEFFLRAALKEMESERKSAPILYNMSEAKDEEMTAKDKAELEAALDEYEAKKGAPLTEDDLPQMVDLLADIRIEQIAAKRLAEPSEEYITFDEMLALTGTTREELDAMPEVEIE